ncbi:unnamed protein product, partial [Microthlaspi erraticum]
RDDGRVSGIDASMFFAMSNLDRLDSYESIMYSAGTWFED